jgi:hypothetical protein
MKAGRIMAGSLAVSAAVVALLAVACGPPPTPTPTPTWQATVRSFDDPLGSERTLTATSSTWWANVRADGSPLGPATLQLHPRTGADDLPTELPTQEIALGEIAGDLAMSERLLAIRMRDTTNAVDEIRVFELDPATATWSFATAVEVPVEDGRVNEIDLSDDTLVIGRPFTFGGGADGEVRVVPLDRSGPGVTWSPASVQVFSPSPTLGDGDRAAYGRHVAVDGDTLAFGAGERVVVLARSGGTWVPDAELLDAAGTGTGFARHLAVDQVDGTGRVLVGVQGRFELGVPRPGQAQLFERSSGGWTLARTFQPDPTGALGGFGFGAQVALDGDRAAFAVHWVQRSPSGGAVIDDYQIELRDLRPVGETVTTRSLLDLVGGVDAGWGNAGSFVLDLSGSHLAVSAYVQPQGGTSRFFTVSFDRRPG